MCSVSLSAQKYRRLSDLKSYSHLLPDERLQAMAPLSLEPLTLSVSIFHFADYS
jgi:hypothetical protein